MREYPTPGNGCQLDGWCNQAIPQVCAFPSPSSGTMSEMAMLRQLTTVPADHCIDLSCARIV